MSDLIPLIILLVLGGLAAGIVLTVIGYVTVRNLTRRVEHLERELVAARHARAPAEKAAAAAPVPPPVTAVPPTPPTPPRSEWASPASTPTPRAATPPPPPVVPAPKPVEPVQPVQRREFEAWLDKEAASRPAEPVASAAESAPRAELENRLEAPAHAQPPQRIEWERWLGVRGAAVLGGIVVAIAGFLFLQYSIERQWITPQIRVGIAALTGLACFIGSRPLRRRGYVIVANSVTGAGAVLLYASSWAGHVLYPIINLPTAFAAMVLVTAACGYLAQRHGSLVIAVLGLVGGFATPLALSSGQNRPIALFGYVLLLDLAYLFVAQKRRWPSLALVALGGTFIMQGLWIFARMERADLAVALVMLAVFALCFVVYVARLSEAERTRFGAAQVGALVLPFVFAIYFAQDRSLGEHVWPLLALSTVLALASAWTARSSEFSWLPIGSASGAVALALTWTGNHQFDMTRALAHELAGCGIGLAIVHALLSEFATKRPKSPEHARGASAAALIVAIGFQLIALYAASRRFDVGPYPWIASTALFALITFRQSSLGQSAPAAVVSGCLVGLTAVVWMAKHGHSVLMPAPAAWAGTLGLVGAVLLCAAWAVRERCGRIPFWGVIGFTAPATLGVLLALQSQFEDTTAIYVALTSVLAIQAGLAATAARSSPMYIVAVASTMVVTFAVANDAHALAPRAEFVPTFVCIAALVVLCAVWPLLRSTPWIDRSTAWRIAAASLLPHFFLMRELFTARWSTAPIFALPFAFEVVAGAAAMWLFTNRETEDRARRVGRIWFSCAAILFAAMIVPLQIDREWMEITLALFAAGIAIFHVKIEARGLAWVAVGSLGIALFFLCLWGSFNSWPHSPVRVWNWVAYTHLLPGIAAMVTAAYLRRAGATVPAAISGIFAVLFVFTWINLEIANAFTTRERFTLRYEHTEARDLMVSMAWIVYAIVLLLLGVSKQRGGLRWASLLLLLLTIGKVFLFDLGHLEGLLRAASVAGLGVSLLLVSVLYQRFVFRRPAAVP